MTATLDRLSPRERVILALLADGLTRPEIAAREHITLHTVKTQCQRLYRKLGVETAAGAVGAGQRLGQIAARAVRLTPAEKLALINRWVVEPDVARLIAAERSAS